MPRTRAEAYEDQRRARMAWAINRCMAHDLEVTLKDQGGAVLATGPITLRRQDDVYGVVVRCGGIEVALPFIRKLELKPKETT